MPIKNAEDELNVPPVGHVRLGPDDPREFVGRSKDFQHEAVEQGFVPGPDYERILVGSQDDDGVAKDLSLPKPHERFYCSECDFLADRAGVLAHINRAHPGRGMIISSQEKIDKQVEAVTRRATRERRAPGNPKGR